MLLWHDSLGYRSLTYFAANYPTYVGVPTFWAAHERAAGKAISGTTTFQTPTVPVAQDTCILGILLKVDGAVTGPSTVFEWRTVGGSSLQVRARARGGVGGFYLQFERGANDDVLLRTEEIPNGRWVFLEVKITFSQAEGKVVVRVDGQEISRVEGVRTEATLSDRGWDAVKVSTYYPGASLSAAADLYLCDGRLDQGKLFASFLGKSTNTKMLPSSNSKMEWGTDHDVAATGKTRLVILAGQSNMGGVSPIPTSPNWRTVNTVVPIWDRITHPAPGQWEDLKPTINTAGMYLPYLDHVCGMEGRFAERIARVLERSGSTISTHGSVRIVKCTQNGSFIFPYSEDYTWSRFITNNLYNGTGSPRGCMITDVSNAIASLGGWGNIECIDFMWLQGESDALYEVSADAYSEGLRSFFDQVRTDFGGSVPFRIHLFVIHKDIEKGDTPLSGKFYYLDKVRAIQRNCPNADYILSIDDCELHPIERLHLMPAGYDKLGDIAFESWFNAQGFSERIDDYETLDYFDEKWVGTDGSVSGSEVSFLAGGAEDSQNSPALAVSSQLHAATESSGVEVFPVAALLRFPGVTPLSGSWAGSREMIAGVALPETLAADLGAVV